MSYIEKLLCFHLTQAANQITKLEGLHNLQNLATLHLRENQLDNLDGFSDEMANLQYINLRLDMDQACMYFQFF